MSVWLDQHKPVLFDDLLTSSSVIDALKHLSLQANPPHLLLSGPAGCGKTTALQLVCRQVLGPSWRATTHVLQARDLDKTAGAMAKFEAFLRPEGAGSEDTLAGRTSLDAFDHNISASADASPPQRRGIHRSCGGYVGRRFSHHHHRGRGLPRSRSAVLPSAHDGGKQPQCTFSVHHAHAISNH